jgi:hypothetical protein
MLQWNKLWKARIGYEIDPEEAAIWESEILNDSKDATAQEFVDAVRTVAERKRIGKIEYRPGLDDMITAIRNNRITDNDSEGAKHERVSLMCREIEKALPDSVKAWTIICDNGHIDEMQIAEEWAEREHGFKRPTLKEMGCKPIHEVLHSATTGEMQEVSKETRTRQQGATS